jgi:hypothetical protein
MSETKTKYTCNYCKNEVDSGYRFCPYCGVGIQFQNTSGGGFSVVVPREISGWNWGAFLLPVIWGPFNEVWLALLVLLPGGSLVMPIILGIKGNAWAWQSKYWDSIEQFKKTQHRWMIWGVLSLLIPVVGAIGMVLIAVGLLGYFRIIS